MQVGGGGGGYQFRKLTHRVLSMYPEVLTPPLQIGTQCQSPDHQFLEKGGTHPQIGTHHQLLDYHFLENRATTQMYNTH